MGYDDGMDKDALPACGCSTRVRITPEMMEEARHAKPGAFWRQAVSADAAEIQRQADEVSEMLRRRAESER